MKVISIWQPWASLIVHNFKSIETRGWPAPKALIGNTIGIASTKTIKPEQVEAIEEPEFAQYYAATGLPPLKELPHGYILGTAFLHSCNMMTEEEIEDITAEELSFGYFAPGRHAWRLRYPRLFPRPIPCRGQQGIWEWSSDEPKVTSIKEAPRRARDTGQETLRRHLRVVG